MPIHEHRSDEDREEVTVAPVEVTADSFDRLVEESDALVIRFHAEWCGPCHAFEPTFAAEVARWPGLVVGECDVDAQEEVADALGVQGVPMVALFRMGEYLAWALGNMPAAELSELFDTFLVGDLDAVHERAEELYARDDEDDEDEDEEEEDDEDDEDDGEGTGEEEAR